MHQYILRPARKFSEYESLYMIAAVKNSFEKKVLRKRFENTQDYICIRVQLIVKIQVERQQIYKIVLHHECFSGMFRKCSDQHFGLVLAEMSGVEVFM